MTLENSFYEIIGRSGSGLTGLFRIALLPGCEVYKGHFPGNPVSPGVCTIQTVKECAERLTGHKLQIDSIRRCRLTAVITPEECPELDIKIELTPADKGYNIVSSVCNGERTYMELKGELTV